MKELREGLKKIIDKCKEGFNKNPILKLDLLARKNFDRRSFLKGALASAGIGASIVGIGATKFMTREEREKLGLSWENYFRTNYRYMTKREKRKTVNNLEKLAVLKRKEKVNISDKEAIPGVLYGYAFNISKCKGYMDCIDACLKENNLDRKSNMQYIKIFEVENGSLNVENGDSHFYHEIPKKEHFYMGTQCMHCENPPCVPVCPTEATWKEEDGIVVVDYDWCIGCRYCEAACPYEARKFNWGEPVVQTEDLNTKQHYLGNRRKTKGVMEKCTFCVQKTRDGDNPACVDACPTGARVFGNLLDPNSEIRKIIATKKVFRLKEELGTEPKFWYYMD
ncbi:MAG: 4Fe-4S dicluster domain-containing protein [Halobacteriovoraceae bacterium]|nr:4Fe-4S dicluster domain-containing protein [Halobacteriovoraceae bacterium]